MERHTLLAAAALAACLFGTAGARVDPLDLSDDRSELELLRTLHGLAQRGEGVLVLRLADGRMVQIHDARDCRGGDADEDVMRCVTHRLIAHFGGHHAFLVRNDHWATYNY